MKKFICILIIPLIFSSIMAKVPNVIKLYSPDLNRGLPVMKALSERASTVNFNSKKLKLEDISDLIWAANGINRPELGKRTAPSAINGQDIDVYVVLEDGAYLYDAKNHALNLVAVGDFRKAVAGPQENVSNAPLFLVLISDISRFSRGDNDKRMIWAYEDAGFVSQNINIFCASVGMITRPRAQMDIPKLREVLKLKDTQFPILNNPVSYPVE
jgi:SagB-type dehydrogenase family enzyme